VTACQQWMRRGLGAPVVIGDFALHHEDNAGLTSAVGVVVSGLNPAATYRLELVGGTGWSRHDVDTDNGGLAWFHDFMVTHTGGDIAIGSPTPGYATSADAFAAFVPQTVTGYASYTLWLLDNVLGDNRPGITVRITRLP
jgi:hypothetical protein